MPSNYKQTREKKKCVIVKKHTHNNSTSVPFQRNFSRGKDSFDHNKVINSFNSMVFTFNRLRAVECWCQNVYIYINVMHFMHRIISIENIWLNQSQNTSWHSWAVSSKTSCVSVWKVYFTNIRVNETFQCFTVVLFFFLFFKLSLE